MCCLLAKHFFQFDNVIGISSKKNHGYIKSLGCNYQIDYKTEKFVERIKKDKLEIDAIINCVAENGINFSIDSQKVLKRGGVFVTIAMEDDRMIRLMLHIANRKFWSFFDSKRWYMIGTSSNGKEYSYILKILQENNLLNQIPIQLHHVSEMKIIHEKIDKGRTVGKICCYFGDKKE